MVQRGSSMSLIFSPVRFSHSSAIFTWPGSIFWSSLQVGRVSSSNSMGRLWGLSCMARLMWALRRPNRVPVIRVPPWMWLLLIAGSLQLGVGMGNDWKAERKSQKTLMDFDARLFWEGCRFDMAGRDSEGVVSGVMVLVDCGWSGIGGAGRRVVLPEHGWEAGRCWAFEEGEGSRGLHVLGAVLLGWWEEMGVDLLW